jgi:hypothetical protein
MPTIRLPRVRVISRAITVSTAAAIHTGRRKFVRRRTNHLEGSQIISFAPSDVASDRHDHL